MQEITGRVVGENESPLDYVNVVLYRDSAYVTGSVTDPNGVFSIDAEINGNLTCKVSFVGYETYVATVPPSGNMGIIRLAPSTVQLGEIVVKATRPSTIMKGNALVTEIEGSSLAIAGTANDVLARVPMVVDNGGTLEVFGKGSPEIYINGRKVNDIQGTRPTQFTGYEKRICDYQSRCGVCGKCKIGYLHYVPSLRKATDSAEHSVRDNGFSALFPHRKLH